jgi:hypothetical protein
MCERQEGKIINIASAAGKIGGIAVGAHYSASKAGIICLTKSLALYAALYNVTVNCVCPGPTATPLTDEWGEELNTSFAAKIPLKRYGTPQEVAEAICFLASDRANYITGETLDVNVTFPEPYQSAELAGKDAVFKVEVKGIKVKELPELDDEFAKDTSEFDTLEELKADIKTKMEESAKSQSESATRDRVIDAVVANMTAEIPDQMVEAEIDGMLQDFEYQLRYQGLDLEKYLEFTGSTMQEMREKMQDDALVRVRTSLTLETISKQENIEVTDEDLEKEFERLAEMQGQSVEDVKKMFGSQTEYMKASIETRKTVDFLVENAKLV